MEDQMCSPEKYWMKNSWNKKIFLLNEKKKTKKKRMIKIFLIEYKLILIE